MFQADLNLKRPLDTKADEEETRDPAADSSNGVSLTTLEQVIKRLESVEVQTSHNSSQLRMLQAWSTKSWLVDKDAEFGRRLLSKVELWKEKKPSKGPHPFGACRAMVGLACVEDAENVKTEDLAPFLSFHLALGGSICKIGEVSVNLASAKMIKKMRGDVEVEVILLKVRPMLDAMDAWKPYFKLLDSRSLESLEGPAPPSTEERNINHTIASKHPKKKGQDRKSKKARGH